MNESQLKMNKIIHDIFHNEEGQLEDYYGIIVYVYKNIDKYLMQLDDIRDKIYLAQWCNNYDKVEELVSTLSLSEYEKNKYLKLREKNSEIDETINFKILSEKYSFLDNIMDMITADSDIQDQILSLADSRLKLFELMYSKLQTLTDYYNPYITAILQRLGYVSLDTSWKNKFHLYDVLLANIDDLMASGYVLSDDEVEKLLYLCTSSVAYTVPNFKELQNFGDDNTIDNRELKDGILKAKAKKDIDYLKFAILVSAYGIGLESAKALCKRYNVSNIKITNENKETLEMYLAIYQIVQENDPDVLIQLYDEFTKIMKPEKDFRRIIVFENDLRKAFAHDLNNQVFKTDNLPYEEINGIKAYEAGVDFKMIVTAIGAYQKNFGIPIVKINREKVAKSEYEKIRNLVKEFAITMNPDLLSQIITTFESSRVGNAGLHAPIREKYFSVKKIAMIIDEIKKSIYSIDNEKVKNNLYFSLYKAIIEEQEKVETCKYKRNKQQKSGIDFAKELDEIEQILANNNIDYAMVGRKNENAKRSKRRKY